MTKTQRENALAMLLLAVVITPFYMLLHPRETRENWRNGRTEGKR
jgi:hypothetical protein